MKILGRLDPRQSQAQYPSVGALLFAEKFERHVDGLLGFEIVFIAGVERTVEVLVKIGDAFANGGDVTVGEGIRPVASVEVSIAVICSTSSNGSFVAVGLDCVSAGLLVPVPIFAVGVSVSACAVELVKVMFTYLIMYCADIP